MAHWWIIIFPQRDVIVECVFGWKGNCWTWICLERRSFIWPSQEAQMQLNCWFWTCLKASAGYEAVLWGKEKKNMWMWKQKKSNPQGPWEKSCIFLQLLKTGLCMKPFFFYASRELSAKNKQQLFIIVIFLVFTDMYHIYCVPNKWPNITG